MRQCRQRLLPERLDPAESARSGRSRALESGAAYRSRACGSSARAATEPAPLQLPSLAQRNQLLLAQAEYHTGETELAHRRLRTLLAQCERLGFGKLAAEVRQAQEAFQARTEAALCGVPDYQDDLTPREISVLKLLAEGMSVREVGNSLFISVNTVKTHAKNINVKLGACRRTQAISCAKAMGILA